MTPKLFLLTWKQEAESFLKEDFNNLKKNLRAEGYVDSNWRMRAVNATAGDYIIIFRQGAKSGLLGFGHILNGEASDKGDGRRYLIRITNLRDAIDAPFIDKKTLLLAGIKKTTLETQSSGNGFMSNDEFINFEKLCLHKLNKKLSDLCNEYCIK